MRLVDLKSQGPCWRKPALLLPVTESGISNNTTQNQRKWGKLSLVVTALDPMLRGQPGRPPSLKLWRDKSTVAQGAMADKSAWPWELASRMILLRRAYGGQLIQERGNAHPPSPSPRR